jgi:hypothetical protein
MTTLEKQDRRSGVYRSEEWQEIMRLKMQVRALKTRVQDLQKELRKIKHKQNEQERLCDPWVLNM